MPAAGTSTSSSRIVVSGSLRWPTTCAAAAAGCWCRAGAGRALPVAAAAPAVAPAAVAVAVRRPGRLLVLLAGLVLLAAGSAGSGPAAGPGCCWSCWSGPAGRPAGRPCCSACCSLLAVGLLLGSCWPRPCWLLAGSCFGCRSCWRVRLLWRGPARAARRWRRRPAAGPAPGCAARALGWRSRPRTGLLGAGLRRGGFGRRPASSGRRGACRGWPRPAPDAAGLVRLDGVDELGLLHGARARDAQARRHRLRSASSMELSPPPRFLAALAAPASERWWSSMVSVT